VTDRALPTLHSPLSTRPLSLAVSCPSLRLCLPLLLRRRHQGAPREVHAADEREMGGVVPQGGQLILRLSVIQRPKAPAPQCPPRSTIRRRRQRDDINIYNAHLSVLGSKADDIRSPAFRHVVALALREERNLAPPAPPVLGRLEHLQQRYFQRVVP